MTRSWLHDGDKQEVMHCPSAKPVQDTTRVTTLRTSLSNHCSLPRTTSCVPPSHPTDPERTPATQHGVTTNMSQAVLSLTSNTGTVAEPNQP